MVRVHHCEEHDTPKTCSKPKASSEAHRRKNELGTGSGHSSVSAAGQLFVAERICSYPAGPSQKRPPTREAGPPGKTGWTDPLAHRLWGCIQTLRPREGPSELKLQGHPRGPGVDRVPGEAVCGAGRPAATRGVPRGWRRWIRFMVPPAPPTLLLRTGAPAACAPPRSPPTRM